jgi:hypothetical protein
MATGLVRCKSEGRISCVCALNNLFIHPLTDILFLKAVNSRISHRNIKVLQCCFVLLIYCVLENEGQGPKRHILLRQATTFIFSAFNSLKREADNDETVNGVAKLQEPTDAIGVKTTILQVINKT